MKCLIDKRIKCTPEKCIWVSCERVKNLNKMDGYLK